MTFTAGDRLLVRGEQWLVEEATAFADTTLLCLTAFDPPDAGGRRCRLLLPFDRPVAAARTAALRAVSRRQFMHHLRAHLSGRRVFGRLRAATRAAIDILPFQLEPALALARGHATRFLLADEVGLGKTIQAGLMLAELQERGSCDRALVVTPAGLRGQWADELQRRFGIRAAVIDARTLAALTDSVPFDVNPWSVEPVAITSIDFLKQPEVARGLAAQLWDLLIVDEAHQAAAGSQRYEALRMVATRARHVVQLSATPHTGNDASYQALCDLGAFDDEERVLLFRRTRESANLTRNRRAHLLPVRLSTDAMAMHRLLDAYLELLWRAATGRRDAQLLAMVFAKRAFSSAHSLAASLRRRIDGLTRDIEPDTPGTAPLPFDTEADDACLPAAPALDSAADEPAMLRRLLDAAERVSVDERKMHALRRILRRVKEPVIVFTEYRDTLHAIEEAVGSLRRIALLHGGQTSEERRHATNAFTTGMADLLLATDAGSEGLNLQATCRLVVNLELPWNPIRLEQRIGRVDRIGQARTVHAINLFADGTAESTVLANLLRRMARIRMSEIEVAACVIGRAETPPQSTPGEARTRTIDLRASASSEADRISRERLAAAHRAVPPGAFIPMTSVRLAGRNRSMIVFFRHRLVTRAGRLVEDVVTPVRLDLSDEIRRLKRCDARSLAETVLAGVGVHLDAHARRDAEKRAREIVAACADALARAIARERHISEHAAPPPMAPVQAGLFDNRALKGHRRIQRERHAVRVESEMRAKALEADSAVLPARGAEIVLLLISC